MITEREESAGKPTNCESKLPNGKAMTREDIIRMAREAGFTTLSINEDLWGPYLERFANLVAAHERDRIADKLMEMHNAQKNRNNYFAFAARFIREEA